MDDAGFFVLFPDDMPLRSHCAGTTYSVRDSYQLRPSVYAGSTTMWAPTSASLVP